MTGGIFMGKNMMKLYFEWRTAVEMAVLDIDNLPEPLSCLEEENTSEEPSDTIELTGKQRYNSRGISVQTLCESCYSLRIELHRIKAQYPVAQLEMRCSGEQL